MEESIGKILSQIKKPGIVRMPADFDKVKLTDEEIELAIFDARCQKYWDEKASKEKRDIEKSKEEAAKPFTAEQLKNFVLECNPWFKVDDQAKGIFQLLCWYFTSDPRFEQAGYSLKKGICMCGPVGVGKTDMLNIFQKNKRQCFHMLTVFDIENHIQSKGVEYVKTYHSFVPGWGNTEKFFYQPGVGWAFDDVGRESVVFDFGNKTDAVSKIIQSRYFKKVPFNSLHITTNKTPDELESRYDEAVRSRLREMFNYIKYTGTDRRK